MHVAIDFSESEHQPTGVGTFTGGVVDAWCDRVAAGSLRLSLLTREEVALPEAWRLAGVRSRASGRAAHPILWQRTRLPGLVREAAPDVFLGPAYALPPRLRVPAAVALHDLSFERFPRAWSWRESWRRRLLARDAARRARRIVTISHFSAAEVEAQRRLLEVDLARHKGPLAIADAAEALLARASDASLKQEALHIRQVAGVALARARKAADAKRMRIGGSTRSARPIRRRGRSA